MTKYLKKLILLFVLIGASIIGSTTLKAQALTGTDFWFMLPQNSGHGGTFGGGDGDYQIFIVSQYCIENATIDVLGTGVSETFSVEPGEFYQYTIDPDEDAYVNINGGFGGSDINNVVNKGVHITSPQPIQVYMMNYSGASSDGETMIPTNKLGLEYVLSFRNNSGSNSDNYGYVVGTENGTNITVNTTDGFGGTETVNISLNQGDVYSWDAVYNCDNDYPASVNSVNGSCITGSTVTADKPVFVMANNPCAGIGACGNCDQMMAAFLPTSEWSTEYVTSQVQNRLQRNPFATETDGSTCNTSGLRGSGDYVEITGLVGTNLTVNTNSGIDTYTIAANPAVPFGYGYVLLENTENIAAGDFGRADMFIEATRPVQVTQYNKGRHADDVDADGNDPTDPEVLTVMPKEYWQDSYFFYPIRSISASSLNVVVMVEDVGTPLPSTSIEINDVNVGAGGWTQIGTSSYYYKRISFPTFESSKIVSTSGAKFGFYFYSEGLRETSFFSGGYGRLEELSLCEQCAEIDINQSGATCEDEVANFQARIYTFTEPSGLNFTWNFGDGNSSFDRNPSHTYTNGGSYTVSLTVDDGKGCVLTTEKVVNVNKVTLDLDVNPNPLCFGDTAFAGIKDLLLTPGLRQSVQYTNQNITPIPDNGNVNSNITIPVLPTGWVLDSVCLNIEHPKVEELQLTLQKGAAVFTLHNNPQTDGRGNFRKTCFTPTGTPIGGALAPFTGQFLPTAGTGMFTTLQALASDGTWTLNVRDKQTIFTGELIDWSIYISSVVGIANVDWQPMANIITSDNSDASFLLPNTKVISTTVTDYTGCKGTASENVTVNRLPIELASRDTIVCSNEGFLDLFELLSPTVNRTGQWLDIDGTGELSSSLLRLNTLGTATYNFKYIIPIFCGNDSAEVQVTVGKLPNLGATNAIMVCSNDPTVSMRDSLNGSPEAGGIWFTYDAIPAGSFTTNGSFFTDAPTGNYAFYYKKPVIGCEVDSVLLEIQLDEFTEVGPDSTIELCESNTQITLEDLLQPSFKGLGRWEDLSGSGGLNASNTAFNPNNLGGNTVIIGYIADAVGGCDADTAFFTFNIQDAPEIELIPNSPVICKDSVLSLTVNVLGGIEPFNVLIKSGEGKSFIRNNVVNGFVLTDIPDSTTDYFDISVVDQTPLACLAYKHDTVNVRVAGPISTNLIAETCVDANNFRATIEIEGGDAATYTATITATNGFSTTVAVGSNPFITPLLPSKFDYTVTITDASNCVQADNVFTAFKDCDCVNNAGVMNLSPKEFCEDATAVLSPSVGHAVPAGYSRVYYLHEKSGIILSNKVDSSFAPIFTFNPATMVFGQTYYVSSVVAIQDGAGWVDLDHRCTEISRGTPISFVENPELVAIGGNLTICEGDTAKIPVEILGTGPFTFEFDTTALGYTTVQNNIDTILLAPTKTTNYFFNNITDGNLSACTYTINPAELIVITVKEAPTVTISGDNIICDDDVADITLTFTGDKPLNYTVREVVNGVEVIRNFTTSRTDTTFNATEPTDFEVINAISSNGCDAVALGGNFSVAVSGRPVADAGGDQTICGLEGNINANPSFGVGEWTSTDPSIFFFDKNNPTTKVIASNYSAKTIRWTETNPPCPVSFDEITLSFSQTPNANAGKDSSICGLSYRLQAIPSIGTGNWQYTGPGTITFSDIFNQNATVTAADPGTYKLVWRESFNNTCVDRDTVKLTFFGALQVDIIDTLCNYTNNTYQLQLAISGGQESSYTVNGVVHGSSNFVSAPISNGTPYNFEVYDNTACDTVNISGLFSCPCLSQAPVMKPDTIYTCYDQIFSALHDASTVRDDNDTLLYVLHKSSVDTLGTIISTSGLNKFTIAQSDGLVGSVFYLSAVVGNKSSSFFGINRNDPCLSVSPGTPIKIVSKTQLFATTDLTFCEGAPASITFSTSRPTDYEVTVTGPNGTFTYTLGTSIGTNTISIVPPVGNSTYSVVNFVDLNNPGCNEIVSKTLKVNTLASPKVTSFFNTEQCSDVAYTYRAQPSGFKSYEWEFEDGTIKTGATTVYAHSTRGDKDVILRVSNANNCTTTYTYKDTLFVQKTPVPDFTVDQAAPYCTNADIDLTFSGTSPDRATNAWTVFGDTIAKNTNAAVLNTNRKGQVQIKLTETTSFGCQTSIVKTIDIGGPSAKILISDPWVCSGDTLEFGYAQAVGVTSVEWTFSDGQTSTNDVARIEVPNVSPNQFYYAVLTMTDANGCQFSILDSVKVSNFDGAIVEPNLDGYCLGDTVYHIATGTNIASYQWRLGNGKISYDANAGAQIYRQAGDYEVSVKMVDNDNVCNRTLVKEFKVYPLPVLEGPDTVAFCGTQEKVITVSGAQNYRWLPDTYLSTASEPNPLVTPEDDITYIVSGTDINGCTSFKTINVIYDELEPIPFADKDTVVVIGDTVYVDLPNDDRVSYRWYPEEAFKCPTCRKQDLFSLVDVEYFLDITDEFGCYSDRYSYKITYLDKFSVDIPDAFTPNGDGINDVIYPRGWGVKHFDYFEVYNRLGVLIFSGSGPRPSWDGTYKGKEQLSEVYYYRIKATIYGENTAARYLEGSFRLIR